MKIRILGEGRSGKAALELAHAQGYEVTDAMPDLAIISPGIPLTDERVQKCLRERVPVIGELEFGLRHLRSPAVGVTGTNGKTTCVALCEYMLKKAGVRAVACGNNGYALCQALMEHDADIFVIEMSSYQLETAHSRVLDAAVILNVTPDHLDRYPSFDDYEKAKLRIFELVKLGGKCFRDVSIEEAAEHLTGLKVCEYGAGFVKPEHRLEEVGEREGIKFINDSKGSNVEAVLHAVKTLEGPLILLAGGLAKGGDFKRWITAFKGRVKKVYAFGEAAKSIERALGKVFAVEIVQDLQAATKKAFHKARIGDTIVLSPGCSSFDQFRDFEHRGEVFKQCVQEICDES